MRRSTGPFVAFAILLFITITTGSAYGQAIKIYWADEFAGRVYKADPDGSNLETIISGDLLNSEEIVFGDGKIYWSDGERGVVQRANTDGTGLETVVNTAEPGPLALDLGAGKLLLARRRRPLVEESGPRWQ